MAYTAWSVVYGEQPTAAKWNQLGANDAGFRDGTNINNSAIITALLNNGAVTADKLGLAPSKSSNATTVSTTSLTYVTPASNNVACSAVVGNNGLLLIGIGALVYRSGTASDAYMSFALSGANTLAADDGRSISNRSVDGISVGRMFLLTGLAAGNTTVTAQIRQSVAGGTGNFLNKEIMAVPL